MKFLSFFIVFGITLCSCFQSDQNLDELWEDFKDVFQKSYTKEEEPLRRFVWEQRIKDIARHNLEAYLGFHPYTKGLNEHSDLSLEEVVGSLTGYKRSATFRSKGSPWILQLDAELPTTLDWRDKGLVTPIKNQKPCGACWAFSATGSLEGQHMKKTGKLVSLSEQNLVDCSEDNDGCNGGDVEAAFEYVIKNGGIDTEESYPYNAENGTCSFDEKAVGAACTGFVTIPESDEEALKQTVALVGPVSVIIDACHNSFINYKSGIFDESKCRTDIPSHAVLVIGYGNEDGKDYWLVKNSWGTSWGMDGYIKMSRNKGNQCGIASRASYPLV